MPYYVANLNIEATYAAITGKYEEFPNLCFVDTLDNVGLHTQALHTTGNLFGTVSEENVARIRRQNSKRISVIIGNPPYNANQANENDNNKNREYPGIDKRIKQTYIAQSTAQKTKLYDMYARFFRWASDRLDKNGVLAFVTNRSFIESRTFDGFRKTVAQEFSDIYVVDLGGDVRVNPKLSGTKHNVFGIQTGVAISFMVKRVTGAKEKRSARVFYARRPEMETADEKLAFLGGRTLRSLDLDEIQADKSSNWINLSSNDFDALLPLASKETKAAKTAAAERAIFKLYSLGVSTNRDEWVLDDSVVQLEKKIKAFLTDYTSQLAQNNGTRDTTIKWSETLKRKALSRSMEAYSQERFRKQAYRPFCTKWLYASELLVDRPGAMKHFFRGEASLCVSFSKDLSVLASGAPFDLHFLGDTIGMPLHRIGPNGERHDNITAWALKQFSANYQKVFLGSAQRGKAKSHGISKQAVFHYCYAVLHDPVYREKYAQNLKRDFPRIPFYADFWQWADWGMRLMELHIGYEQIPPFPLVRTNTPDEKARAAGLQPKAILRSNPAAGTITLDSETALRGVPAEAWAYKLGNRSAVDWVLDQYKERKPKDPTIREKFDTYRFADYKEKVIDLLARVTTVSVETVRVTEAMKGAKR